MIKRIERGWAGHYICSDSCKFRRNTLLDHDGKCIVVSTIGNMYSLGKNVTISADAYYETLAFFSDPSDFTYHDADVSQIISIDTKHYIEEPHRDIEANEMHERVVSEIIYKIENGIPLI